MNCVQLVGRLTADPTATTTGSGIPVTRFRVAVERPGREGTDYFTIKTWERTAEVAAQHLSRGRRVALVGRLEHGEWTDTDHQRRSRIEVVATQLQFLDPPPDRHAAVEAEPEPAT